MKDNKGIKEGYCRHTYIIPKILAAKINAIAERHHYKVGDVVTALLDAAINSYEQGNGKLTVKDEADIRV